MLGIKCTDWTVTVPRSDGGGVLRQGLRLLSRRAVQPSLPAHSPSGRRCLSTAALREPSVAGSETVIDQNEAQRRLDKAVGLIQTADELAPFDRVDFSAPLLVW